WVTPLLLARHVPSQLSARVPCGQEPALPGAGGRSVLLATARETVGWNGLQVVRSRVTGETVVRVGGRELARVPAKADGKGCSLGITMDQKSWTVYQEGGASWSGRLASPPGVTGLITELDLHAKPEFAVSVRPIP